MSTARTVAIFEHAIGWEIRTFTLDGAPHFAAADICKALGLTNTAQAMTGLDDDEKGVTTADTPGGRQQLTTVNEPGLYSLILRSRKPEAKAFKRWITHEVIPQIRQTGSYSEAPAIPTTLHEALVLAADLELGRIEAETRALAAEAEARALHPSADAWNTLAATEGDYGVAEAAKLLSRDEAIDLGQNRLFDLLAELGWTFRSGYPSKWVPKQAQVDCGRLVLRTYEHGGALRTQVRVTPKGLAELHRRLGGTETLALPAEPVQLALVAGGHT